MEAKLKLELIEKIMREHSGNFARSEDMLTLSSELTGYRDHVGAIASAAASVVSLIAEGDSVKDAVQKVEVLLDTGEAKHALDAIGSFYAMSAMVDGHDDALDATRLLIYNYVGVEKKATEMGIMFGQIMAAHEVIPGLDLADAAMNMVRIAQHEDLLGLEAVLHLREGTDGIPAFVASLLATSMVSVSLGVAKPYKWLEIQQKSLEIAERGRDKIATLIGFDPMEGIELSSAPDFSDMNLTPDSLNFLKGLTKDD